MRSAIILLAIAFGLIGCSKKEKPQSNAKVQKFEVSSCVKKKQYVSNDGKSCVSSCPLGQKADEKTNRCLFVQNKCGAPGTGTRNGENGCEKACPKGAELKDNMCICSTTGKQPNNGSCAPPPKQPDPELKCEAGSGTVKKGNECVPVSAAVCKSLGKFLDRAQQNCLDSCPEQEKPNEAGQCVLEQTNPPPPPPPGDCKEGEVKVGEKCLPVSGENCKKADGKILNRAGSSCVASCPAAEVANSANQCEMRCKNEGEIWNPQQKQCVCKATQKPPVGGKCEPPPPPPGGNAVEERLKKYDTLEVGKIKSVEIVASQRFGTYNGRVEKKADGKDAYVRIDSLKVTFSNNVGGGTNNEASYAVRGGVFAKRDGWIFLALDRKKSKIKDTELKLWVGCLDDACSRIGFRGQELASGAPAGEFKFEVTGEKESYSFKAD